MMTFEQFQSAAASATVVPLIRTTLADLHTPVSAYLALREQGEFSFLFESVEPDEKIGRFSFIGTSPVKIIRQKPDGVEITFGNKRTKVRGNIFDVLATESEKLRQADIGGSSGFLGGFVGYLGYPAVAHIERLNLHPAAPADEDEAVFGLFRSILRFDHREQSIMMIHNVMIDDHTPLREAYEEGRKALDTLELRLRRSVVASHNFTCDLSAPDGGDDAVKYKQAVEKAKRHIFEGDIFQVVLSRRLRFTYKGDLFPVYRALRKINPSPYLFFLDCGETQLAGSSPEVLVRVFNRQVEVLPIAGTRHRGKNPDEDQSLAAELLRDEKELAEHVMLVDLGRNDVGRVSKYGSVSVPVFKRVDRYSHVMHIVSEVHGTLRDDVTCLDALKACFPAGTVSGAPKVKAMEIINDLEGSSRGVYAGAVGYLGFNGTLDTCIAIRTIVAHRGLLSVQVGAGIVADSVPEREYRETQNKSAALLEAIRAASNGLTIVGTHTAHAERS